MVLFNRLDSRQAILHLGIFFALYMSSSFLMANNLTGPIPLALGWLTLFAFLIPYKKNWGNGIMPIGLLMLTLLTLSMIINEENSIILIVTLVPHIIAIGYALVYSYEEFSEAFVRVMVCVCAIALICYVGSYVSSFFLGEMFIRPTDYKMFYNFYNIHFTTVDSVIHRNAGMFWEPGAFQAYISLAILLYIQKENANKWVFTLFTLATITTFSTTGYIFYTIILILVGPTTPFYKRNKKFIISGFSILIFLAITYSAFLLTGENSTFGKLVGGAEGSETTSVRYYSFFLPFEALMNDPIFGLSYTGLQQYTEQYVNGMVTCTFANYFGMHGLIYGLLMIVGYWKISKALFSNLTLTIIPFGLFFLVTFSENMLRSPIFILLPLMGYANRIKDLRY